MPPVLGGDGCIKAGRFSAASINFSYCTEGAVKGCLLLGKPEKSAIFKRKTQRNAHGYRDRQINGDCQ